MAMSKTQLVAAMHERLLEEHGDEWTKGDVKAALDVLEEIVIEECTEGSGAVNITGFVKFARVDRPARMGRNPATGEKIKIKAKSVAKATALKRFKDAVLAAPKKKNRK